MSFCAAASRSAWLMVRDRKSTRLNSSHVRISYAVFCLKKKNNGFMGMVRHRQEFFYESNYQAKPLLNPYFVILAEAYGIRSMAVTQLFFFFFNDPATTEIYTLSLHDALPIFGRSGAFAFRWPERASHRPAEDRKSTRLNSSHVRISYAVFCLKKKKKLFIDLAILFFTIIHQAWRSSCIHN